MSESRGPVSVCVVSDLRFYREGLARVLASADGILVPATAPAGADGLREIVELRPDVVLLDATMPATGLVAHRLAAALPDAKIVALAVPQAEEELTVLLDAGVVGYVTREQSLEEVAATILDVAAEQMVCPPGLRTLLGKRVRALASGSMPSVDARLTARELEILDLVAQGLLNKEIARALHIQEATVKNHVHHILEKLNVQTRMAAVAEVRHRMSCSRGLDPAAAA